MPSVDSLPAYAPGSRAGCARRSIGQAFRYIHVAPASPATPSTRVQHVAAWIRCVIWSMDSKHHWIRTRARATYCRGLRKPSSCHSCRTTTAGGTCIRADGELVAAGAAPDHWTLGRSRGASPCASSGDHLQCADARVGTGEELAHRGHGNHARHPSRNQQQLQFNAVMRATTQVLVAQRVPEHRPRRC